MEAFTTLTDQYVRSSAHHLANSALPHAPVLPYIEPRRRLRRLLGTIRHPVARPVIAMRPASARYSTEC
jgi:hypothetical protein